MGEKSIKEAKNRYKLNKILSSSQYQLLELLDSVESDRPWKLQVLGTTVQYCLINTINPPRDLVI